MSHDGTVCISHTEWFVPTTLGGSLPEWVPVTHTNTADTTLFVSESTGTGAESVHRSPVPASVISVGGSSGTGAETDRGGGPLADTETDTEVPLTAGWRHRAEAMDRQVVLKQWYAREHEKRGAGSATCDPRHRSEDELLASIISAVGSGARPVCTECARWYRVRLLEPEFRRLRVTDTAVGDRWHSLAPDDRVLTAARTLRRTAQRGDTASVPASIDCDYVTELVRREVDMTSATKRDPPVVFARHGGCAPQVIDGHHRTAAAALTLVDRGEYGGIYVFLGVETDTDVGPLRSLYRTLRNTARQ